MARPPTKPVQREGRITFMRLMGVPFAFPTDSMSSKVKDIIDAINAGDARKMTTEVSLDDYLAVSKFTRNHAIPVQGLVEG